MLHAYPIRQNARRVIFAHKVLSWRASSRGTVFLIRIIRAVVVTCLQKYLVLDSHNNFWKKIISRKLKLLRLTVTSPMGHDTPSILARELARGTGRILF